MITALKDLFPRIDAWPSEDQEALVEAARGIEAERTGVYQATADELGWRKGAPILGELNRFRTRLPLSSRGEHGFSEALR